MGETCHMLAESKTQRRASNMRAASVDIDAWHGCMTWLHDNYQKSRDSTTDCLLSRYAKYYKSCSDSNRCCYNYMLRYTSRSRDQENKEPLDHGSQSNHSTQFCNSQCQFQCTTSSHVSFLAAPLTCFFFIDSFDVNVTIVGKRELTIHEELVHFLNLVILAC